MKRVFKKNGQFRALLPSGIFSIYGVIVLLLLYIALISSFKSSTEIVKNIYALPKSLNLSYYGRIIFRDGFIRYMLNSFIVTLFSIAGMLICSCMLAYGHARFEFRGRGLIETYILLGMMFPIQLGVLVNFRIIKFLGLTNTLIGLILIYIGNLSLSSFLFMKFFRQLPYELAESAKIDGANEFVIFAKIMLPLSKPVIGTVTLVCGLTIYNDFYLPLIFLNGNNRTATVILQTYLQNFLRFIERIFPMAIISIIPIIILFIFAQKQLVEGLTVGALKN
jgi:raffinose/stachyose/melibiose transport system permease protein